MLKANFRYLFFVGLYSFKSYFPQKTVLNALSSITKHGSELAETVVEADIYPSALLLLKDVDEGVRRSAMELTKEICKQSADLSQLMVSIGTVGASVDYLNSLPAVNSSALPAVLALGFISAHSESLASSVISGRAVSQLGYILEQTNDAKVLGATVWTLGQIGQHSAEHARSLTLVNDVLKNMLNCALGKNSNLAAKVII